MNRHARILVVDDDEHIRMVWYGALTGYSKSWQVEMAGNGREALEILEQDCFDLLVTDLKMPEMNGLDLTLAAQRIQPDIPVIWITSFSAAAHPTPENQSLDIYRCLIKPLSINEIRKVVAEALTSCPACPQV